jgi:hypothetical protein
MNEKRSQKNVKHTNPVEEMLVLGNSEQSTEFLKIFQSLLVQKRKKFCDEQIIA